MKFFGNKVKCLIGGKVVMEMSSLKVDRSGSCATCDNKWWGDDSFRSPCTKLINSVEDCINKNYKYWKRRKVKCF